jgi:hypothetical protein
MKTKDEWLAMQSLRNPSGTVATLLNLDNAWSNCGLTMDVVCVTIFARGGIRDSCQAVASTSARMSDLLGCCIAAVPI